MFALVLFALFLPHWSALSDETSVFYEAPLKPKDKIKSTYSACKNRDLSSVDLEGAGGSLQETEAKSCMLCFIKKAFGFGEIKEAVSAAQSIVFKKKLQKRVIGQIESKLFQTKAHKACIKPDRKWFEDRKIDWPLMKQVCANQKKELKTSIKNRWSKMRVNLSLISPGILEDRIITDRSTWFDSSPSHFISSFKDTSLPKLTAKEKKEAEKLYIDQVSKIPLEHFSGTEFKKMLSQNRPLPGVHSGVKKYLTDKDQSRLRTAVEKLREKAKNSYFQAIEEQPVLAYLERNPPGDKDLDQAFSKMEEKLTDFLKKAKDPEADMGLLLSFKPLVEEILREDAGYCLVAEKARIKAERNESFQNWVLLGAGVLAAVPCFVSGPIGASVCLAGGMGLGVWGYKEANIAKEESLGRSLTGKKFETIAGLSGREREEFLAKLFLPLGAWGTTAVPARAASNIISKAVSKTVKGTGRKGARLSIPPKTNESQKLKSIGFNRAYARGIDEANEWIAIASQMREQGLSASEHHIDYLADKMREHIQFMKKGIKTPEERRRLEELTDHIKKTTKEKRFTYEQYIKSSDSLARIFEDDWQASDYVIKELIDAFPDRIAFATTTGEMGVMTMNRAGSHNIHTLGLIERNKHDFFQHDLGHIPSSSYPPTPRIYNRIQEKTKKLPLEKRKNIELGYWVLTHENLGFFRPDSFSKPPEVIKERIMKIFDDVLLPMGPDSESFDPGELSGLITGASKKEAREQAKQVAEDFYEFMLKEPQIFRGNSG